MSKLLLPLLILCLAAWLFGGAAWFGSHFSVPKITKEWRLTDGEQHFVAPNPIAFSLNSRDFLSNAVHDSLLYQIADYLANHPNRHLRLTGKFTDDEVNNSDRPNLGIARAESLQRTIYGSGIIDIESIEISYIEVDTHTINPYGLIDRAVEFEFFESPLAKYGEGFKKYKEFFFENDLETTFKQDADFDRYVQSVRQYLADFPEQHLWIKAFHQGVSKDQTTQKRVDEIINQFGANGIKKAQIKTEFESLGETAAAKNMNGYLEVRIY